MLRSLAACGLFTLLVACAAKVQPAEAISVDAGADAAPVRDAESVWDGPSSWSPWKATSVRLQVDIWGPWTGYSGYDNTRDLMSPEQLAKLDAWVATPPRKGTWTDKTEAKIRITDADGSVMVYRASQYDEYGKSEIESAPVIAWSMVRFPCLFSGGPFATGKPDASNPWTDAPIASDDRGCIDGVKQPSPCPGDSWIKLKVPEPANYKLTASECTGTTRIRIHAHDAATELATSPTTVSPACPELTHHFAEPGTYLLAFERTTCNEPGLNFFKFRVTRL